MSTLLERRLSRRSFECIERGEEAPTVGHLPEGEMADVQPVWRKVELLIEWLVVLCQGGLDRREGEKMALEEKQVRRLLKSRNK